MARNETLMLMSLPELHEKYGMKIESILHVGAHLAEEASLYDSLNVGKVWWIEGNPQVIPKIKRNLKPYNKQIIIEALVYSTKNVELDFNITNYDGMSSSILEFGTHPTFSPDTIFVDKIKKLSTTIDDLVAENSIEANFLNMDLQGAELHALQGATNYLETVDYIITEVNNKEVYVNCAKVDQLDKFLKDFRRVETFWVKNQGWGDACYVRKDLL